MATEKGKQDASNQPKKSAEKAAAVAALGGAAPKVRRRLWQLGPEYADDNIRLGAAGQSCSTRRRHRRAGLVAAVGLGSWRATGFAASRCRT